MMFALIWMLCAVTGASAENSNNCLINSPQNITAQAGSCVVLPCHYECTCSIESIEWNKCDKPDECSKQILHFTGTNNTQPEIKGRVSLLESDPKKNCSIIISNLASSDSGFYQVKVKDEKDSHKGNVHLTVAKQKPSVMLPPLTEGRQTTLTCTAPGFCSGSKPNITWMWRGAGADDSQIKGNITGFISDTKGYSSTLTFNVSAEHHNTNIICNISFSGNITTEETKTLQVSHLKISGNQTVMEGDGLNLTCVVGGFNATSVKWTKDGSEKILNETKINDTLSIGPVPLTFNVTTGDAGLYICTATNQNTSLTAQTEINVAFTPKILNVTCHSESEVLTCVCVSEGFPLPTITWPLVEKRTNYSVMINVSKPRVTSTLTVSIKGQKITTVECVSKNELGMANHSIGIKSPDLQQQGGNQNILCKLWEAFKKLDFYYLLLIGFVIGILLSTMVACLVRNCRRGKGKKSRYQFEDLEMTTQTAPKFQMEQGHNGIQDQEKVEERTESAGQLAPDGDVEPKETDYSDIDFSAIRKRIPTDVQEKQGTTETEYAEIKKEGQQEGQGEVLEVNDEEERLIKENENPENCMVAEGAVCEDVPLYPDVTLVL